MCVFRHIPGQIAFPHARESLAAWGCRDEMTVGAVYSFGVTPHLLHATGVNSTVVLDDDVAESPWSSPPSSGSLARATLRGGSVISFGLGREGASTVKLGGAAFAITQGGSESLSVDGSTPGTSMSHAKARVGSSCDRAVGT